MLIRAKRETNFSKKHKVLENPYWKGVDQLATYTVQLRS